MPFNVAGTPGSGFGPSGEGDFRLSAFGPITELFQINDYKQSTELLKKAMNIIKSNFGDKHPTLIDIFSRLSKIYWRDNKAMPALELLNKSISLARELLPANHPKTAELTVNLKSLSTQLPGFRTVKRVKKQKKR